ncbi:universal stress protein [Arthrobacter sp. ZGTC412]|uniref:universal stress protein n=1 Tax=Arthrobacter sp. ZGTC412 TaxID=2058900 RepID=UPI000CE37902|nr:universal stress protein [Arthrobacter sp. ZGTC412]
MAEVVVVGVDGSETALKAARRARDLAAAIGGTLHVVTAFDGDRTVVFGTGSDQWVVSNESNAEEVAKDVAVKLSSGELKVSYSVVKGSPAQALIGQAEKFQAGMIVVGNKRLQGIGRVLGSIASSVAHNAPCDVYIVKTNG